MTESIEMKDSADQQSDIPTNTKLIDEIYFLVSNAWPVILSLLSNMLIMVVCLFSAGHVTETELAATGFGIMFCNVAGFSIVLGLASGLETVASQLFGAGQFRQVGVALQRTIYVTSVATVPIALLWVLSPWYMTIFVEPDVALSAGRFVLIMSGALPGFIIKECVEKYLNAQGIFRPTMYIAAGALLCHIPICWYLVVQAQLGAVGAAISLATVNTLGPALLVAYITHSGLHSATWHGWTREALTRAPEYLRIAIPSCCMICLEWWCFELVTLISARLGTTAVAAQAVMFNTNAIFYMIGLGFSVTVGMRVGTLLGAGQPALARRAAVVGWASCAALIFVLSCTLYLFRRQWAEMFTLDEPVLALMGESMPIQASFLVFDSSNAVLCGAVRGCGQQHVGVVTGSLAFYVLAMPLGTGLAFGAGIGLRGLWYGLALGAIVQSVLLSTYLARVDWGRLAERAARRVDSFGPADHAEGGRVALAHLDEISTEDCTAVKLQGQDDSSAPSQAAKT